MDWYLQTRVVGWFQNLSWRFWLQPQIINFWMAQLWVIHKFWCQIWKVGPIDWAGCQAVIVDALNCFKWFSVVSSGFGWGWGWGFTGLGTNHIIKFSSVGMVYVEGGSKTQNSTKAQNRGLSILWIAGSILRFLGSVDLSIAPRVLQTPLLTLGSQNVASDNIIARLQKKLKNQNQNRQPEIRSNVTWWLIEMTKDAWSVFEWLCVLVCCVMRAWSCKNMITYLH